MVDPFLILKKTTLIVQPSTILSVTGSVLFGAPYYLYSWLIKHSRLMVLLYVLVSHSNVIFCSYFNSRVSHFSVLFDFFLLHSRLYHSYSIHPFSSPDKIKEQRRQRILCTRVDVSSTCVCVCRVEVTSECCTGGGGREFRQKPQAEPDFSCEQPFYESECDIRGRHDPTTSEVSPVRFNQFFISRASKFGALLETTVTNLKKVIQSSVAQQKLR